MKEPYSLLVCEVVEWFGDLALYADPSVISG
jgi:hypothetical protein